MTATVTPKSTAAEIRAALAAAGIEAPARATKAALLDLLRPETAPDMTTAKAAKPAALPEGVEVRVAKIRTTVKVDGRLVAYLLTADRAKVVKVLQSGDHKGRAIAGLHDTWVRSEHAAVVLAVLSNPDGMISL